MERFMGPVCNGLYWRILTALSHCDGQWPRQLDSPHRRVPAQSSGIYGLGFADLHHDNSKLESIITSYLLFPNKEILQHLSTVVGKVFCPHSN